MIFDYGYILHPVSVKGFNHNVNHAQHMLDQCNTKANLKLNKHSSATAATLTDEPCFRPK